MANPTTNFGWQMPTATDLVTDLPADFEIFGQAVDTSLVDLKGGTTGQILAKASNTNMDFTWITNDVGDITEITATSPLTGGGTSGAVTIGILSGTTSNLGAVQLSTSTSSTSTSLAATASAVKSAYDLASTAAAAIKSVRKSSDQTVTSSTTLVNDSQLKFAVAANETYIFETWLYTFAADGTPDIKVTFTGPSGSTVLWSSSQVIFNAAAATTLTSVNPGGTSADLFVDANNRAIQLYGTILNGATAGDVQLQWAQNTSSANGTSVKAGSYIYGIKVS
jgi:hypothetical protein